MKNMKNMFVTPHSASDLDDLDSILDSANVQGDDNVNVDDNTVPPDSEGTEGSDDNVEVDGTIETQAQKDEADKNAKQKTAQQKQEYAFGQMRQQNNTYFGILEKLAKANGIEYKDRNDLVDKMSNKALDELSVTQKVPKELLEEIDTLKRNSEELLLQKRQERVQTGFKNLIDSYGLTEQELHDFATELDSNGINPMASDKVDITAVYKMLHFDDILEKEKEKAVQNALKKSGDADAHSTVPSNKKGKGDTTGKITTVDALNNLLDHGVK